MGYPFNYIIVGNFKKQELQICKLKRKILLFKFISKIKIFKSKNFKFSLLSLLKIKIINFLIIFGVNFWIYTLIKINFVKF